jgi:hypothetical protein
MPAPVAVVLALTALIQVWACVGETPKAAVRKLRSKALPKERMETFRPRKPTERFRRSNFC